MIRTESILEIERYIEDTDVVLFDLDDTLYSEKEYVRSGYRAIAKAYPLVEDMFNKLWKAFEAGEPAVDYVLAEENLLSEKENCLKIYRWHKPDICFYAGVKELLLRISSSRKIGIITDGRPEGQHAKIESLGLEELVDKIIITDELGGVGYRKPNEKAFILMKEYFNTEFSRMVYVGDNIKKDFIAPEKLGMKSIYFYNPESIAMKGTKKGV